MLESLQLPFRVTRHALDDWWREWVAMAAVNMAWLLMCATIVLAPPATFALFHYARQVRLGRGSGPRELLDVGRRRFVTSWLWFMSNLAFGLLMWSGATFYSRLDSAVATLAQLLLIVLAVVWLSVQFYLLPYLVVQQEVQQEPSLRLAYRNALLTTLASPLFTLTCLGISSVVVALSFRFAFLFFLGAPSLVAMIATHGLSERLEAFGVDARASS